MSDQPKNEWLETYHSRLQSEYEFSSNKKDTLTNWSLTILLAMLGFYFGDFVGIANLESASRLALVIGTLIIVIQFFVNSMLSYGFLKKWRYLKELIEKHWMDGKPTLEDIKKKIALYDHGRRTKASWREMIWAQLRAGFLLILGAPILLAAVEVFRAQNLTAYHYLSFVVLAVYMIWQIVIFLDYDQFRKPKNQ